MTPFDASLLTEIRNRFAHVESCPFQGPRIFFENAGGALTLKTVVETSATYAALPDNQGRDNPAARALGEVIAKAKADATRFFNAGGGQIIVGESGTELLFRLIRTAACGTGGDVIGATVEHPASRSAAHHWAQRLGRCYISVPHDHTSGTVGAQAYAAKITENVTVATILHTSPVTGMANDIASIAAVIRERAPEAFIIVDGIQHASQCHIDVMAAGVDGYVISPYKVFSRHGYGIAWVSDRLSGLPLEQLAGGPAEAWELGTRDTGAYATFSDVVAYFDWLGQTIDPAAVDRAGIEAAARAIHSHETRLTTAMLQGTDNLPGLTELPGVTIIGGAENPAREGLVTFALADLPAARIVASLNSEGIRTHIRKADHYSGNILSPLGLDAAVRVSLSHYNSLDEVRKFLAAMKSMATS